MKKNDERLLKAALGGMAVVNNIFRANPAITAPVTAEAIIISVGSIAMDTIDFLEDEQKTKVKLVIKPEGSEIENDEGVWF